LGKAGHADHMLKAHSRDLGQRQQLMHAKLHHNHTGAKAKGASHLLSCLHMLFWSRLQGLHVTFAGVACHICRGCVSHLQGSRVTLAGVACHMCRGRVSHVQGSRVTFAGVACHICRGRVSHLQGSRVMFEDIVSLAQTFEYHGHTPHNGLSTCALMSSALTDVHMMTCVEYADIYSSNHLCLLAVHGSIPSIPSIPSCACLVYCLCCTALSSVSPLA